MYTHLDGLSRLIEHARDVEKPLTNRCEADLETAVRRGLAEYLQQLSIETPSGRTLAFTKVYDTFGDLDEKAVPPVAGVQGAGDDGMYEPKGMSNIITRSNELEMVVNPSGKYARGGWKFYGARPAEYRKSLQIEMVSQDKPSRMWLCKMLEDDFNPEGLPGSDPQAGFELELPHYHGVRAVYAAEMKMRYEEAGVAARQGRWKAWCTVSVSCPQIRVVARPVVKPRVGIAVNTPDESPP